VSKFIRFSINLYQKIKKTSFQHIRLFFKCNILQHTEQLLTMVKLGNLVIKYIHAIISLIVVYNKYETNVEF